MNLDGVLLFLFFALTLPTAAAWVAFRRELIPHHLLLGLWPLAVTGMVAVCANVPFGSVDLGKGFEQILTQFSTVFGGIGVLLAVALGFGAGELLANVLEKNNPKPI